MRFDFTETEFDNHLMKQEYRRTPKEMGIKEKRSPVSARVKECT